MISSKKKATHKVPKEGNEPLSVVHLMTRLIAEHVKMLFVALF
jgi:hypothetical protein